MSLDYILSFAFSLLTTLIAMPILIPFLHKIKFGQVEREEGLASHKAKGGTPTMGGLSLCWFRSLLLYYYDLRLLGALKCSL